MHLVRQLIEQENSPAILVDAGNLLFTSPSLHKDQVAREKPNARAVIQALSSVGKMYAGIGARDLTGGIDFIRSLQQNETFTWLSSNLVDKDNKEPLFSPYVLLEVGQHTLALVGLTDSSAQKGLAQETEILSWQEVLAKHLPQLKGKADMVILLSSFSPLENTKIAEQFPEIAIIFQSGHYSGLQRPKVHQSSLITQVASRGKYLGRLDFKWNAGAPWINTKLDEGRRQGHALIRLDEQIRQLEARGGADSSPQIKEQLLALQKHKAGFLPQQVTVSRPSTQQPPVTSSFTYEFIALKPNMTEDPYTRSMVDQAERETIKIKKQQRQTTRNNQ